MFNFSIFGGNEVRGQFKLDLKNTFVTLAGGQEIDLREVSLPDDTPVKIIICTLFGGAKVIVPPGTPVDIGGIMLIGGKKTDVTPGAEPSRKHLRISFNCLAGGLEVTSKGKDQ